MASAGGGGDGNDTDDEDADDDDDADDAADSVAADVTVAAKGDTSGGFSVDSTGSGRGSGGGGRTTVCGVYDTGRAIRVGTFSTEG